MTKLIKTDFLRPAHSLVVAALTIIAIIMLWSLSGCGQQASEEADVEPASAHVDSDSTKADKVIATVNGQPVYESELTVVKNRMLGKVPEQFVNKEIEANLVRSLVRSKAMAQQMLEEIEPDQLAGIEAQTRAFRDELLIRIYVEKHGNLNSVSMDEVKNFYAENPHLFGGGVKKTIEYISVGEVRDRERKISVLSALNAARNQSDWASLAEHLKQQQFDISYKKLETNVQHLSSPLKETVKSLTAEQGAQLISETGIYLVRVQGEQTIPARPLSEVGAEIRRSLQAKAFRNTVETLSDEVMANTNVQLN